jgi:hypothetical protein
MGVQIEMGTASWRSTAGSPLALGDEPAAGSSGRPTSHFRRRNLRREPAPDDGQMAQETLRRRAWDDNPSEPRGGSRRRVMGVRAHHWVIFRANFGVHQRGEPNSDANLTFFRSVLRLVHAS